MSIKFVLPLIYWQPHLWYLLPVVVTYTNVPSPSTEDTIRPSDCVGAEDSGVDVDDGAEDDSDSEADIDAGACGVDCGAGGLAADPLISCGCWIM